MNVTGFGPLNWIAGKSVTNVIQENVLQVNIFFSIDLFHFGKIETCKKSFVTKTFLFQGC